MKKQELHAVHALVRLYHFLMQQNDNDTQKKTLKLIEKGIKREVQIAFCGHFSAGKSSLINHMMGESILPTSPIPTSANIVKLQRGSNEVTLSFLDGHQLVYEGDYHFDQVQSFCRNGEEIEMITISSKSIQLPEGCALLDTPGIDSIEDAHRISTESTLHLADIILYVVDYNHVQSQENFLFLKDLHDVGKKVYFIVNQIDKHDERELPFTDFQATVMDAFLKWGISVEEIFYTSLVDEGHQYNQLSGLKDLVYRKLQEAHENLSVTLMAGGHQLIDRHLSVLDEQNHELWRQIDEVKQRYTEADMRSYAERLQVLQVLQERPNIFEQEALETLGKLLKNVYLLTADTRELVRLFLESEQKDYKVGMLFSRAKTATAREERRRQLYEELLERKKTQLDWHLKNWADQYLQTYEIKDEQLIALGNQLEGKISMDWMQKEVAAQSEITGAYVLHFSEQLTLYILNQARTCARNWIVQFRSYLEREGQRKSARLNQELAVYSPLREVLVQAEVLLQRLQERKAVCEQILLSSERLSASDWQAFLAHLEDTQPHVDSSRLGIDSLVSVTHPDERQTQQTEELRQEIILSEQEERQSGRQAMLVKLERVMKILQNDKLPDDYLLEIVRKQSARLLNQTYTIALFGAFSAGKSSFANALLGRNLLPVSPNPTTAVINRVQAATANSPSGTAEIFLKRDEVLLEELRPILGKWNIEVETIADAFTKVSEWLESQPDIAKGEHAYFSFIQAFYEGFPIYKHQLGSNLTVSYEAYCSFAIEEKKSCFVEEIILYYDCPFTAAGLVLVDTPGADSIHARHTQTSFQYIKDCDAMIYVTYYNHPFSRADQEFLIQLGRVKDAFTLDKMFFICNAIDLARTKEELQMVLGYIQEQLEGFGIRMPRLHAVSSREALREQEEKSMFRHAFLKDSQFMQFKYAFDTFVAQDLTALVVDASQGLLESVAEELARWIEWIKVNHDERAQKLERLETEQSERLEWLHALQFTNEQERLHREKEELCYYLIQRVFLRFPTWFTGSFNSALLQNQTDIKAALQEALGTLCSRVAFDMEQELRALDLRLERFVHLCVMAIADKIQAEFMRNGERIHLTPFQFHPSQLLVAEHMADVFAEVSFQKELGLFQTPKRFFEMNGRKQMEAVLKNKLQGICEAYLRRESNKRLQYYQGRLQADMECLKKESRNTLKQSYQAIKIVLQVPLDLESMENCYKEISKQIKVEVEYVC